jgi:hypothetical protein
MDHPRAGPSDEIAPILLYFINAVFTSADHKMDERISPPTYLLTMARNVCVARICSNGLFEQILRWQKTAFETAFSGWLGMQSCVLVLTEFQLFQVGLECRVEFWCLPNSIFKFKVKQENDLQKDVLTPLTPVAKNSF